MTAELTLNPGQIAAELESQPPLMRQQVAKSYIGKAVNWLLVFRNAYEKSAGRVGLLFVSEPSRGQYVTGTVTLSEYPALKQLRAGEIVQVRGNIRDADMLQIELQIEQLTLPTTTAVH